MLKLNVSQKQNSFPEILGNNLFRRQWEKTINRKIRKIFFFIHILISVVYNYRNDRNSPISHSSRMTDVSIHICLSDYIGERRSGIHTAVSHDVDKVFKGKTLSQLEMLEQSIKKKLKGGEGVDVGKLLLFHLAKILV